MEVLNLLPDELIAERRRRRLWIARGTVAGAVLMCALLVLGCAALLRSAARHGHVEAHARRDAAKERTRELAELEGWIATSQHRTRIVEGLIRGVPVSRLLATLTVSTPRGVTLSDLSLERALGADAGGRWDIRGAARGPADVAAYLGGMVATPELAEVDLSFTEQSRFMEYELQRFQVTGRFDLEGVAP